MNDNLKWKIGLLRQQMIQALADEKRMIKSHTGNGRERSAVIATR